MKKYSYVDAQGNFKGPHTLEELRQLKDLKVVGNTTQVMDETVRKLTTLSEILAAAGLVVFPVASAGGEVPPVEPQTPRRAGTCIACGGRVPATITQCPYCQTDIRRMDCFCYRHPGRITVAKMQRKIRQLTPEGDKQITIFSPVCQQRADGAQLVGSPLFPPTDEWR